MLESGINDKQCAAQTWGYDGKRRYLLRLEQNEESAPSTERPASNELLEGELARRYVCKITMYAEGRQNAASNSKPSILASRMAALWPFGGGDRELLFDFLVYAASVESGGKRLVLNEIRVATPLGAIIGGS
jgi:hypothetical protein